MKKITLALFVLFGMALNAQIYYYLPPAPGNPGGLNTDDEFPVGGGLSATWTVILGPSQSASGAWSPSQTVPFSFQFNGLAETSYKVSSTGVLTFNTAATSVPGSTPASLPSSSIPDKSIMAWGITGTGASDQIVTKTFGTAPNRQHWIFFTSYTMPGAASSWSYWSIVLEETTNNIYIVDQRNANGTLSATLGVQVNSTTAYAVAGSPNVGHLSGNDATAADNFYYAFLVGPQPAYDAKGLSVDMPNFVTVPNAPFSVKGEFQNLGTATITTATINYKIDGGATVSAPVTGLSLNTFATATITHPTSWNGAIGTHNVEVWLSNLNGNADVNPSNDKVSKTVNVVGNATERFPLYETFTSSTCPPCVPANTNMEALFNNATNLDEQVSLKYQMSWPGTGDPYLTAEGTARRGYYAINSVPWVEIDGGWNGNGNSLTQAIMDGYKAIPSFVGMDVTYSINNKTVCVDVELDPLSNISGATLHIAIKEKKTTANVKTNGETEFFNVMKKMVPNENGTAIAPLVNGTPASYSFCYTFNGSYRLPNNASDPINHAIEHSVEEFADLAVAVWLQNAGTKEVYQAAEGQLVLGINDFDPISHNMMLYPNPANDFTSISIDMDHSAEAVVNVVNTLGQTVISTSEQLESGTSKIQLATAGLSAGVYFVNVEIEGATQTLKLTVR